jgi:hypothetical protein
MTTTLAALQAGVNRIKWVMAIEGVKQLISDATTGAVQTAYTGTAFDDGGVSVLQGLSVDLRNSQTLEPWNPFVTHGRCVAKVLDVDRSDTFGIMVSRRNPGTETQLSATVSRSATTIPVKSTTGFTSSGYIYIGTECIKYTGVTGTSFTGCTRGMFSPHETGTGGSGGARFGNYHRKGQDANHLQLAPVVTQLPRMWIGKRVAIRMHLWDPATNTINPRDAAQLVFAGRIVSIADDPATFETVLELEHAGREILDGVIGRDFWAAEIPKGMWLAAGRVFKLTDGTTSTSNTANDLTVVTSGAAGANQMNQGFYTGPEIVEKLNTWLAAEQAAARIKGVYHWRTPVSNADGLRTVCDWRVNDASSGVHVNFKISMPGEVASFLGLRDAEPAQDGALQSFAGGTHKVSNTGYMMCGSAVPFSTVIFKPTGPGRIAQEFTEVLTYSLENEHGTFVDNTTYFPASIKTTCTTGHVWGLFIVDEKVTMVGAYDSTNGYLQNCWLAPFQLVSDNSNQSMAYIGRRCDEPDEPIKVRQVVVIDTTLQTLVGLLLYSSGTAGYNHGTYDSLGYGIGLGMPGELFGNEFDRSLANLPGASAPTFLVLEESKRLSDVLEGDLLIRNAFLRWKDQHFEFAQWKTPLAANAIATFDEETKAAPVGQSEGDHRVASQETDYQVRPVIKLEYGRDFSSTRGTDTFLRTLWFEDQTMVDDAGGNVKPRTISLRNTYAQFTAAGAAVEALLPKFLAAITLRTQPQRRIVRSLSLKFWEGYSVGDVVAVTDKFARDPVSGRRQIAARPAIITKLWYNPTRLTGEVELMFFDAHRGELYAPSAQVDETAGAGGFTAGYNAGTSTLRTYQHKFSHTFTLNVFRGRGDFGADTLFVDEPIDAARFAAGDKILIVEIDPANPAAPISWERTVQSVSSTDIMLTAALAAPAFDATKKYRITYQKFSQVALSQQDYAFQASSTSALIENVDPPDHFCVTTERYSYVANSGSEKGELIPEMLYGDGRAWDVGTDRALIIASNQFIDRKSAHQSPLLWNAPEFGSSNPTYVPVFMGPVFFGTEQLSAAIARVLTLAPFMRSNTGGTTGYIRATLSRSLPVAQPGGTPSLQATAGVRFVDHFVQFEWTTTSSTYAEQAATTLSLGVKEQTYGYAWLIVERKGTAEIRGFSKFIEGVRTLL